MEHHLLLIPKVRRALKRVKLVAISGVCYGRRFGPAGGLNINHLATLHELSYGRRRKVFI